jgi:hypothetical protein
MREAVENVQQKKMGWKLASKTFNVPSTTLRRRVRRNMGYEKGDLGECRPTFSKEIEDEIVSHITNMETRFLGLTTTDVKSLAYQLAEGNHIPHKFNRNKEEAGWAWLHRFIGRNPTISLQTPENTSAARAQAFNRVNVAAYFKNLDEVLTLHNFSPENIYNMDETGFSTVQTKPEKIYATAFIFPRKNMKPELMDNAPTGSICFCQESYAEVGRALHKICKTKSGKQSVTSIAWSREPQTSQCFGKSQRIRNHPILFPRSLYPQMPTSGHRFFRATASLLQSANSSLAQGSPWQSSDTFASGRNFL